MRYFILRTWNTLERYLDHYFEEQFTAKDWDAAVIYAEISCDLKPGDYLLLERYPF